MKLKTSGISKYLMETLKTLQEYPLFDDYNLVGGTALSLQLGHRISIDIDLFTEKDMDRTAIGDFVKSKIDINAKIRNNSVNIFQMVLEKENLKIDFVKLPYGLLDPLIITEGIRMVGLNDISAMKISATGTRGYEAKDFFDLYYLLKEMTIDTIFDNFKKKYGSNDILHYVRSSIYFDDVPDNSWKALKPLKEVISKDQIKEKLIYEVTEYQKRIIKSKANTNIQ